MPSRFVPSGRSRRSLPHTYATFSSARLRTSLRRASGAHDEFASENATTSRVLSATARFSAASLPPRGSASRRTRGSPSAYLPTISSVRSVEPCRDHALLVVRGDDHRDARRDVVLAHRACANPREQRRGERIADMRPDDAGEARPEQHPHDDHGRKLAESVRSRRSPPGSTPGASDTGGRTTESDPALESLSGGSHLSGGVTTSCRRSAKRLQLTRRHRERTDRPRGSHRYRIVTALSPRTDS